MRRIGAPSGRDVHAVFWAPVLFGISKVPLDVEPQTILVHERRVGESRVTAEQDDVSAGLGAHVGLHEEDDMPRLRALCREKVHLIDTGLSMPLDRGPLEGDMGRAA